MSGAAAVRRCPVGALAAVLLVAGAACVPASDAPPRRPDLVHAMMTAEDARPPGREGLTPLLEGLESPEASLRQLAVRGLGRQERPDLVPDIRPLVEDPEPGVRRATVSALARAVSGADPGPVIPAVLMRLTRDPDAGVRAVAAGVLGRLPYPDVELAGDAAETLLRASHGMPRGHDADRGPERAPPEVLVGVTAGVESLLRLQRDRLEPPPPLLERLRQIALAETTDVEVPDRARRLALRALVDAGGADRATLRAALADDDAQVRRIAAGGLVGPDGREDAADPERPTDLIDLALADPSPMVRVEAMDGAARLPPELGCPRLERGRRHPDPHVALRAVDGLAGCPGAADVLAEIAAGIGAAGPGSWHRPAHALVALARVAPGRAAGPIDAALRTEPWPARMYAARAAGEVGALRRLAEDVHPNVAEAALRGLSELRGHAADRRFLDALAGDDYQLLITAADALSGSPLGADAVPELLAALERVTAREHETSRDVRLALLRRIGELGDGGHADRLVPYLADFDPRIAETTAGILGRWTGRSHEADPGPLPRLPVPTPAELAELETVDFVVRMRDGSEFTLELLAREAPTNAARFARLARAGTFDGLTFHRVVPNFVVQGGSPGANEYVGDGPYTRDELTRRPHLRGTVGVSTRGRDTGDGQIFINLVDNPRLDHEYTIFARVRDGMDAVDAILEADVIDTIVLRPAELAGR